MAFDECPYCKADFTAGMWCGDPLDEGEEVNVTCHKCGKEFKATASYSLDFYTEEVS